MPRTPLTAIPATRSSRPVLKAKLMLVIGFLAASTLSGIFATVAWIGFTPKAALPDPTVRRDAQALAEVAAQDFLDGRSSAVPAAKGVLADFTPQAAPGQSAPKPLGYDSLVLHYSRRVAADEGRVLELESFYASSHAADGTATLYDVTVPMLLPAGYGTAAHDNTPAPTGPVLAGSPAIVPANLHADTTQDPTGYTNFPGVLKSDAIDQKVVNRVKQWAQVFATACGDSQQTLLGLTGQPSGSYQGLCGWSADPKDVSVNSAVAVSSPQPGLIVDVSLVLHAPGSNGPTLSTQYDLYVGFTGQDLPPVYAWGPAGSFSELNPGINAR